MDQFFDFFRKFFSTSDFPARWHCGKWSDFHGWLYIISELLVWSAYMAIPILILYFIQKKKVPFNSLFLLFAAFILACGFTHLLDAVIFWVPVYRLSALARFLTGIISWATVFAIFRILPFAFSMRTSAEYDAELKEKIKAQQELSKTNILLNQAQHLAKIGYWEWDPTEKFVNGTNDLFELYGLVPGKNKNTMEDFFKRIHGEDQEGFKTSAVAAFKTGKIEPSYHRTVNAAGELTYIMAQGEQIINEDGRAFFIGTVQDITAFKKMEENLLYRTKELENRVSDLQRFAYVTSHDLKEPLRKISIFSSRLQSQFADQMPEKAKEYLGKIYSSSERQLRLIDEILQLSNLSNITEHSFEKYDLSHLAQEAIQDISLQIEGAEARVTVGQLPEATVIATQIQLVFRNLISNALKFRHTERQCEVNISGLVLSYSDLAKRKILDEGILSWDSKQFLANQQFCLIQVEDNGIGIEEQYKEDIFEIFKRLHGKEFEGTGLGLAICKRIVEIHHGEIAIESVSGEGSVFSIALPLSQKAFYKSI